MTSAWYRHFLTYDPVPALKAVKVPVLALLGGKDIQVTTSQNAPLLRAALAGNPRAQVVELPGLNHLLQECKTGSIEEYATIEQTMSPAALKVVTEWVGDRAKVKSRGK